MRTLAGLQYKPHSPSLYELATPPGRVALVMSEFRQWHVWTLLREDVSQGAAAFRNNLSRPLPSLDAAARLVANAFGVSQ